MQYRNQNTGDINLYHKHINNPFKKVIQYFWISCTETSREAFYVSTSFFDSVGWTRWKTFSKHYIVFFLSYPTRVSCPVCSNKLCSNTDTVSRRLWAPAGFTCLGFQLYGCIIDYLIPTRVVERWGNISQYTNLAQLNLRPERNLKYECNSAAVCHRVFSEWVSQRIGRVPGVNFTIPQAPNKTSPSPSPPRLALFSIQSNAPIKRFNIPHFATDVL